MCSQREAEREVSESVVVVACGCSSQEIYPLSSMQYVTILDQADEPSAIILLSPFVLVSIIIYTLA